MKRVKAWMPLYVSDFIVATLGWDADAVGHYIRLLLIQWDRGSIPATPKEWDNLSPHASKHFDMLSTKFPLCEDGRRRNFRLEEERDKAQEVYHSRVLAGLKGAEKRWGGASSGSSVQYPDDPSPPTAPKGAATRGAVQAKEAYGCAPKIKQQGWKRFLRLWEHIVLRQLLDQDQVIQSFHDYYGSPTGSSKYARGPHRLLEEEVWEDDPSSWGSQQTVDASESMNLLDDILKGGE